MINTILAFNEFNFNGAEPFIAGGIIGFVFLVFALILIVKIFYLITLSKALKCCAPECQKMAPGMVWLEIIPILGMVWAFINIVQVSGSLGDEFRRRQIPAEDSPSMVIGVIGAALMLGGGAIPFAGIAGLVCWIIYWVKISGYTRSLMFDYSDYQENTKGYYKDTINV